MLRSLVRLSSSLVRRHLGPVVSSNLRFLHSSRILCAVRPAMKENTLAYSFLRRDPKYQGSLSPLSDDFYRPEVNLTNDQFILMLNKNEWTNETILDDFAKISYFIRDQQMQTNLTEPCFDIMVSKLIEASSNFDFNSLCKVLFCMSLWPSSESTKSRNFCELWNHLDKVCNEKFNNNSRSELLVLCDHWYRLHLLKIGTYGRYALKKVLRRMNSATGPEIIQGLFYANVRRHFPITEVVNLQVHLEKVISSMSAEEVGICAMAFFKTSKRIVSFNLMEMMLRKFITHADTVDGISISCMMKAVRMGLHIGLIPLLEQLYDRLYPRVEAGEINSASCLHLILAGTNVQLPHYPTIKAVTKQLLSNTATLRLKDMERLALVLQMYNMPGEVPGVTDNAYKFIMEQLFLPERQEEINRYPRSFTSLLHFLSVQGYMDNELSNKALGHEFLNNVYLPSVEVSSHEILSLDVSVEVECPDYKGARLPPKGRAHLTKLVCRNPIYFAKFIEEVAKGSFSDKVLKRIAVALTKVIGEDWKTKIFIGHALPNFYRPDIFFKLSPDGESFEDIPQDLQSNHWIGEIKYPDSANWVCINVWSRGSVIRNSENLDSIGSGIYRMRLLEKIGYNLICIKSMAWPQDEEEQLEYLQNLINECRHKMKNKNKEAVTIK